MLLRETMDAAQLLDRPDTSGALIQAKWAELTEGTTCPEYVRAEGATGSTDVIQWTIPGRDGLATGGHAPTLLIAGLLGGVGVRALFPGLVSDADGALVALATALKLCRAAEAGDGCRGDVKVVTHICPDAPTQDSPVIGQVGSPISIEQALPSTCLQSTDALVSVTTTRGHRILNHTGIAITPTLVNGLILRVSDDLMNLVVDVTNELPSILPITMQDILPANLGAYRINSIMEPGTIFSGPVVGIATTAHSRVSGRAPGATPPATIEVAARLCVEAARAFGSGGLSLYDPHDYSVLAAYFTQVPSLAGERN